MPESPEVLEEGGGGKRVIRIILNAEQWDEISDIGLSKGLLPNSVVRNALSLYLFILAHHKDVYLGKDGNIQQQVIVPGLNKEEQLKIQRFSWLKHPLFAYLLIVYPVYLALICTVKGSIAGTFIVLASLGYLLYLRFRK